MAMTLRLPADLRVAAQVMSKPDTLRALAAARESVRAGDVVYGSEAVLDLVKRRRAS